MCFDPLTLIIGALSSVAQFAGQMQQSKQNEKNALQAFRNDQTALTLRQLQEQEATAQKTQETNIEEAQKVSEVKLSAAGGGVAGISVANIVGDVKRRAERNRSTQIRNTQMTLAQLQQEKEGARATAQSRINSVPRPSALSLIAGIAGAGLDSYNTNQRRRQPA